MCALVRSEVPELILVRDNDSSMRKIGCGGAGGGAEEARLREPPRRPWSAVAWKAAASGLVARFCAR